MNTPGIGRITSGSPILAAVVASILGAATATAQDQVAIDASGPRGIEEIVVTATRREESLQDVPLAVSALTADSLIDRGVKSLAELSPGTIPSVVMAPFAGTASVLAITQGSFMASTAVLSVAGSAPTARRRARTVSRCGSTSEVPGVGAGGTALRRRSFFPFRVTLTRIVATHGARFARPRPFINTNASRISVDVRNTIG